MRSIQSYLEKGTTDMSIEVRRPQIRRWIEILLDPRNSGYQVRLSDTEPALELDMKTTASVILGGKVNEETPLSTSGRKSQWTEIFR